MQIGKYFFYQNSAILKVPVLENLESMINIRIFINIAADWVYVQR